jgi:hypothetical protein
MAKSDVKFRNAKSLETPYKLGDTLGLYLLVNPSGAKYWRLKYRLDGKEKLLAVAVYPDVENSEYVKEQMQRNANHWLLE